MLECSSMLIWHVLLEAFIGRARSGEYGLAIVSPLGTLILDDRTGLLGS